MDICDVFDSYWYAAHPSTHYIRSRFKTRVPASAEQVRVRPYLINNVDTTVTVCSFGDYTYLADQSGANAMAMIETFVSRNGGARILCDRAYAMKIARLLTRKTRAKLFTNSIKPLSLEELSNGFDRFLRKVIQRGRTDRYLDSDLLNIQYLQAFMKTQLKSKWEPTKENFHTMYEEVQKETYGAAMEGKAGQGVLGWSKPLCWVFAAWINAIEARMLKELKPWVVYATQLSETAMVGKINAVMGKYHKCVLVKGDDVCIIYMDINGQMRAISWDAEKFDSSQASIAIACEAMTMHAYGMPLRLVSYFFNFMENNRINSLGKILSMTLHFSRHSGGMDTLWGNTNHSMNMIGLVMKFDDEGDWRTAQFDPEGMRLLKSALGASLKIHEAEVGDFVGYIIQDFSMRPDIFRLCAKIASRNFSVHTNVTRAQADLYRAEHPTLPRDDSEVSLYHGVVEYSAAVRDRLSVIISEEDRVKTIRANATLYMPEVPIGEAMAKISTMLDVAHTFGDRKMARHYYEILRRKRVMKHYLPIRNDVDDEDQSHIVMNMDNCERVIADLRLIHNAVHPVEDYEYAVDHGWKFDAIKHRVEAVAQRTRSLWVRFCDAIVAKIQASRFARYLRIIVWLINKIRPRPTAPLEPVPAEEDDEEPGSDDSSATSENESDEDAGPHPEDEEWDAARGYADYYAAIEARVNRCLEADPKCTKTFASFKGKRVYESGAAYKLLDCISAESENWLADEEGMMTVCDIGCAPGGCTQVFAEFAGVSRVIAINAPKDHPGHLAMKYQNAKVDLRSVDVNTLDELPEAEYYFCDVQNLTSREIIRLLHDADAKEKPIAIKSNHLDDALAHWLGERVMILKPPRSNRYSSEFYIVTYEHENAMNLATYLNRWSTAVADLEARRLPTPHASDDNELAGQKTLVLDEAYALITNQNRRIRSVTQLTDLLRAAHINHRIVQNRAVIAEYTEGAKGRTWEVDLDSERVELIEDQKGDRINNEPEPLMIPPDAPDDLSDAGSIAAAFINQEVSANQIRESELTLVGPFAEECVRSLVSNWSTLHPIGFSHLFKGWLLKLRKDPKFVSQFMASSTLFGFRNAGFLVRYIMHSLHNHLATGALPFRHRVAVCVIVGLLNSQSKWMSRGIIIPALLSLATGQEIFIVSYYNMISYYGMIQNCKRAISEGWFKALKVATLGVIYPYVYMKARSLIPKTLFRDYLPSGGQLENIITIEKNLRMMMIEPDARPDISNRAAVDAWTAEANNKIMRFVADMQDPIKATEYAMKVNSASSKMNVPVTTTTAAFLPVSQADRLDVSVVFDGPQPIKFDGPQPIEPITFEEAQPTFFEEPQHVIVDQGAGDKIFGFLQDLVTIVAADDRTTKSALRIATDGNTIEVVGGVGGSNGEVRITGCDVTLPTTLDGVKEGITLPIRQPSRAIDVNLASVAPGINLGGQGGANTRRFLLRARGDYSFRVTGPAQISIADNWLFFTDGAEKLYERLRFQNFFDASLSATDRLWFKISGVITSTVPVGGGKYNTYQTVIPISDGTNDMQDCWVICYERTYASTALRPIKAIFDDTIGYATLNVNWATVSIEVYNYV